MQPVIIGDATLYCGSCEDILPLIGRVDACITDPPYGIGADKGASGGGTDASGRYKRRPKQYEGSWDSERPDAAILRAIAEAGEVSIVWGGNYFADVLPQAGRWLFWDKLNSMPTYSDGEMAWTSLPGAIVKKFTRCNNGLASLADGERVHPTQKPIALMAWCIEQVKGAQTVLDPFMGSGTTGVAAIQLGRKFIGIERDERYFEIACRRIEQAVAQGQLFAPEPAAKPVQDSLL